MVPGVGLSRVRSCPVHGPVSVDTVVEFDGSREMNDLSDLGCASGGEDPPFG